MGCKEREVQRRIAELEGEPLEEGGPRRPALIRVKRRPGKKLPNVYVRLHPPRLRPVPGADTSPRTPNDTSHGKASHGTYESEKTFLVGVVKKTFLVKGPEKTL
jgi:hypothetical protein